MAQGIETKRAGRGRPKMYANDAERKAARALAARKRRAAQKEEGFKEVRRMIKTTDGAKPTSTLIDLSAIYNNKRD